MLQHGSDAPDTQEGLEGSSLSELSCGETSRTVASSQRINDVLAHGSPQEKLNATTEVVIALTGSRDERFATLDNWPDLAESLLSLADVGPLRFDTLESSLQRASLDALGKLGAAIRRAERYEPESEIIRERVHSALSCLGMKPNLSESMKRASEEAACEWGSRKSL
ncbi:MAG: hypothetical protein KDD64_00795 [Bdellovibrionales bacterium]|nr:hypothetical protein [Bdellovibrionales bacterium]